MRETTLRQLLIHIVNKVDANLSLDIVEIITLHVIEHVDETTSSEGKRKRAIGRTCATDLLDETVYSTMHDCPPSHLENHD